MRDEQPNTPAVVGPLATPTAAPAGLGLYVARGIAEAHDGELTADSMARRARPSYTGSGRTHVTVRPQRRARIRQPAYMPVNRVVYAPLRRGQMLVVLVRTLARGTTRRGLVSGATVSDSSRGTGAAAATGVAGAPACNRCTHYRAHEVDQDSIHIASAVFRLRSSARHAISRSPEQGYGVPA